MSRWLCSQFGARENYAVPRALHHAKLLTALYTDLWIDPTGMLSFFDRGKRRYHSDLAKATVHNFNTTFLSRHIARRMGGKPDDDAAYDTILAKTLARTDRVADNFFGYSYSSQLTMKEAKAAGYRTFLGQINPGPAEAELVRNEFRRYRNGQFAPTVPDAHYWEQWREEVQHSDVILVNSEWSSELIEKAGVPKEKISVLPLAYEVRNEFRARQFSEAYNKKRPLRLLYLGGVGIRKGFHTLTNAMKLAEHLPVTLDVVGELKGPAALLEELPVNVKYFGAVDKAGADRHYSTADVFILPTLSDGFGLTQLEAQARKLPLIVSSNCAHVIDHMHNGIVLPEVTPRAIADAITMLIDRPELLPSFSEKSVSMEHYGLQQLAERLNAFHG